MFVDGVINRIMRFIHAGDITIHAQCTQRISVTDE
jgi:hypothetical protein